MTREDLQIIVWAVLSSAGVGAIVWKVTWPHFKGRVKRTLAEDNADFRDLVFEALQHNEARFQEWNREYWQKHIEEWSMGASKADDTHREVTGLKEEFRQFRNDFAERMEQFATFGTAIVHLEGTMKELNVTLRAMRDDHAVVKQDVAVLKDRRRNPR